MVHSCEHQSPSLKTWNACRIFVVHPEKYSLGRAKIRSAGDTRRFFGIWAVMMEGDEINSGLFLMQS
jgi:hypothetical protein